MNQFTVNKKALERHVNKEIGEMYAMGFSTGSFCLWSDGEKIQVHVVVTQDESQHIGIENDYTLESNLVESKCMESANE